jgi:hypothetical protein
MIVARKVTEMKILTYIIVGIAATQPCMPALASCENIPSVVSAYLAAHPEWSIVDRQSLVPEDRALWNHYHPNECPGFAEFHPGGSSPTKYALALLAYRNNAVLEQVIVIGKEQDGANVLALPLNIKTTNVPAISVIYRVPAARYHDVVTGQTTKTRHEALVYESIGAGALLYYLENGRYHTIQTSE